MIKLKPQHYTTYYTSLLNWARWHFDMQWTWLIHLDMLYEFLWHSFKQNLDEWHSCSDHCCCVDSTGDVMLRPTRQWLHRRQSVHVPMCRLSGLLGQFESPEMSALFVSFELSNFPLFPSRKDSPCQAFSYRLRSCAVTLVCVNCICHFSCVLLWVSHLDNEGGQDAPGVDESWDT